MIMFTSIYFLYLALINSYMDMRFANSVGLLIFWDKI